jgi:hypothetical protein
LNSYHEDFSQEELMTAFVGQNPSFLKQFQWNFALCHPAKHATGAELKLLANLLLPTQ